MSAVYGALFLTLQRVLKREAAVAKPLWCHLLIDFLLLAIKLHLVACLDVALACRLHAWIAVTLAAHVIFELKVYDS